MTDWQNRVSYEAFLESKAVAAVDRGYSGDVELSPLLKPHQAAICSWAIAGGNRAIFADFGLGKSVMQLQIAVELLRQFDGSALIVAPLGVRQEFVRDAKTFFNADVRYIRTDEEHAQAVADGHRLFITNYERVRDGKLDPNRFLMCSLDEASVLRSFGSKTFQTFLTLFDQVRFKFVATATPAPNRFKELIHYAAFLGIMDSGQALTRWFQRNSEQAGDLTLYPHKEAEFYLWLSTWATFLTKPSDLGFDDAGYVLPPLNVIQHRLSADHASAGFDSWGQGKLLRDAATSLSDAAREKRDSLSARIEKAREIMEAAGPDEALAPLARSRG